MSYSSANNHKCHWKSEKKILFIITNDMLFVAQHLNEIIIDLNNSFKVVVLTNLKTDHLDIKIPCSFVHIPIRRKPSFFIDFLTVISVLNIKKRYAPKLILSFTPKAALINSLVSILSESTLHIHYFTGQVWSVMTGLSKYIYMYIDKITIKLMTNTLCDSNSQKLLIKNSLNLDNNSTPICLGHGSISGVDTNKFQPSKFNCNLTRTKLGLKKNDFILLFVGRIAVSKGIDILLDVFSDYLKDFSNDHLLLVGPIEDQSLDLLIKKSINTIHIPYSRDTSPFFQAADLFVFPSKREGFGTAVIEAGSTGLASLVSDIPGLRDAIEPNQTALMFSKNSRVEFLDKLKYLRNNNAFRLRLGQHARLRALEKFSKEVVVSNLSEYIKQVML